MLCHPHPCTVHPDSDKSQWGFFGGATTQKKKLFLVSCAVGAALTATSGNLGHAPVFSWEWSQGFLCPMTAVPPKMALHWPPGRISSRNLCGLYENSESTSHGVQDYPHAPIHTQQQLRASLQHRNMSMSIIPWSISPTPSPLCFLPQPTVPGTGTSCWVFIHPLN